jgi:hypothetical protein
MGLPGGEHDGDGLAAALGAQVQLGRQPTTATPERFVRILRRPPIGRGGLVSGTGGVLVGAHHRTIHKVQQPVHLAPTICLGLQACQHPGPDPLAAPGIKAAGHGLPGAVPLG